MSEYNINNNFGLPFDLPDYQDMEAILEEMAEGENMLLEKYNEEKIRIDKVRRARQILNNSTFPKNSITWISIDKQVTKMEQDLAEEYRQIRKGVNPQKQIQSPQYAPKPQPQAPSYSVNTGESKPVTTRTEFKPTKKLYTNYENVSGWLVGIGGVALVIWIGIPTVNFFTANSLKPDTVETTRLKQLGHQIKWLRRSGISNKSILNWTSPTPENQKQISAARDAMNELQPKVDALESEFYPLLSKTCNMESYGIKLMNTISSDIDWVINRNCK